MADLVLVLADGSEIPLDIGFDLFGEFDPRSEIHVEGLTRAIEEYLETHYS